ncbi:unnamed protein product, partial [Dibothriocephalus latus]
MLLKYLLTMSPICAGLNLDQPSCLIGHCELLFSYADGEALSASLHIDGVQTAIRPLPGRSLKSAVINFTTVKTHTFQLTVNDEYKETRLDGNFNVDEAVKGLNIVIDPIQGVANMAVEVTVMVFGGTSYSLDLSDGGDFKRHVPARPLQPLPNPQVFKHTYTQAGAYSICVTVRNLGKRNVECHDYIVAAPMGAYDLRLETSRLPIGQPLHLWL